MVKTATAPTTTETISENDPFNPTPQQPKTGVSAGLRPIAEIVAALEQEVTPDIIQKLDSYDYIPWPDAVRLANRIFGVAGWDNHLLSSRLETVPNDQGELTHGYTTLMRIVVFPADTRAFQREGLGFSELIFSKPKGEKGGAYYKPATALIDSSIKGSASRALLRTLVLMGEQFGLSFYEKHDTQAATGAVPHSAQTGNASHSTATSSTNSNAGSGTLTPGQIELVAKKFNTTPEHVAKATAGLSRDSLKPLVDRLVQGGEGNQPWKLSEAFGGLQYVKRGDTPAPLNGTRDSLPIPT